MLQNQPGANHGFSGGGNARESGGIAGMTLAPLA